MHLHLQIALNMNKNVQSPNNYAFGGVGYIIKLFYFNSSVRVKRYRHIITLWTSLLSHEGLKCHSFILFCVLIFAVKK